MARTYVERDEITRLHDLELQLTKWQNELELLRRREPDLDPAEFRFEAKKIDGYIGLYESLVRKAKRSLAKQNRRKAYYD